MKLSLLLTFLTACSFSVLGSQSIKLAIEVIEHQSYGTTLYVKEGCEFHGYHKDKTESVFLAKCGNKLANYKVKNSDWDIRGFNIESDIAMEVPLKLRGGSYGIDIEKAVESLANQTDVNIGFGDPLVQGNARFND
ncbi:hypothetical protein NB550_11075 [Vibrio parahaemolyticus]|uniref:hypothetical protein n=1 Tax=Vibrio parahaemolyticus TaxID=670 RepID=UPI00215CDF45|nr:hypothetical protein [Vibrio parahaemolyticus]MCR9888101.1 hypothetical protein [Vibrio parahaemolyticus]MCR9918031.1 hypothetical protein [Vibrio parahaemolyticus]